MPENYQILVVFILLGIVVARAFMAPRAWRAHEADEITVYDVARKNGTSRRDARRLVKLDNQVVRSEPAPKKRLGPAEQHD